MTVELTALLTLKEVAPLARHSYKSALAMCERGTFPIRHAQRTSPKSPYRFTAADVAAYTERGEITNPLVLHNQQSRRRYFKRAS